MSDKDASLPQTTINLQLLFELLGHKETNYAFFGVSRIRVISKIIGPVKTREDLIPELRKFVTTNQLYSEISELIVEVIHQLQGKNLHKS